jgi:hypothetical protein
MKDQPASRVSLAKVTSSVWYSCQQRLGLTMLACPSSPGWGKAVGEGRHEFAPELNDHVFA